MSDQQPPAPSAPPPTADDALSKYKKLLSVARQSLEANQKKLGEKDKTLEQLSAQVEQLTRQKEQLVQALENELMKSKHNSLGDDDVNTKPRRISRRVDVADQIWLLFEYTESPSSWSSFGNEQEALDFVSRLSGEPLQIPHRCFTPDESSALESECRRKIELLGEEFRRFKVQTSIAQKQKDARLKNTPAVSFSVLSKASTDISAFDFGKSDSPVPNGNDDASRWRAAYETAMAENERLRSRGEEAIQASQWRERFETCERERNEALDRLQSLLESGSASAKGNAGANYTMKRNDLLGPGAIYQRYLSLKEEYEIVRKKLTEAESTIKQNNGGNVPAAGSGAVESGRVDGYSVSRVQHSRHLVLQYLSCKDRDVRIHMEDALMALFRATESEKIAILSRRRAEDGSSDSYVSSLTGMLGLGESTGGGQFGGISSSSHG